MVNFVGICQLWMTCHNLLYLNKVFLVGSRQIMSHMLFMSFDGSNFIHLNRTLNRFMEYAFGLVKTPRVRFCYIGTASKDRRIERIFFTRFVRAKFGKKNVRISKLVL